MTTGTILNQYRNPFQLNIAFVTEHLVHFALRFSWKQTTSQLRTKKGRLFETVENLHTINCIFGSFWIQFSFSGVIWFSDLLCYEKFLERDYVVGANQRKISSGFYICYVWRLKLQDYFKRLLLLKMTCFFNFRRWVRESLNDWR